MGSVDGCTGFGLGCSRISRHAEQCRCSDSVSRGRLSLCLRQSTVERAGLSVHPSPRPGNLHERTLLGSVAFSLWTAGISLRVSATIHRRLAHDQLFRLCGAVPYRVARPGLLRRRVSLGAANLVRRAGNHALASHQRREDKTIAAASTGGSLALLMDKIDNSQRTAAKVAGWSGLLTFAIVVFGNYVLLNPLIVPGNAAATAQNIVAHQTQLRITVVCFLTYSLGVVVLLSALYVILKPINPGLAL